VAILVVAMLAGACGGKSSAAVPRKVVHLTPNLPSELQGLSVHPESTSQAEGVKRPYIDGVALFSLRKGPLLEATLEVGRFSTDADYKKPGFRSTVVAQIGVTVPQELRMGDRAVYLTSGRKQSLAVWFKDRYFFILTSRDDYATPRTLLRTALEIQP
jgi:hypothetical protein